MRGGPVLWSGKGWRTYEISAILVNKETGQEIRVTRDFAHIDLFKKWIKRKHPEYKVKKFIHQLEK